LAIDLANHEKYEQKDILNLNNADMIQKLKALAGNSVNDPF